MRICPRPKCAHRLHLRKTSLRTRSTALCQSTTITGGSDRSLLVARWDLDKISSYTTQRSCELESSDTSPTLVSTVETVAEDCERARGNSWALHFRSVNESFSLA